MKVSGTTLARAAELRVFPVGIFSAWAILSFDRLADLWVYTTGGPRWMALLLPLSLDCLTAMAWLRYQRTGDREALAVAAGAALAVISGNGVSAAITGGYMVPTLALTIAVAAVPPAAGVVALHLLAPPRPPKEKAWTAPRSGSAPATGDSSVSASSAATGTSPKPASRTAPAASPSAPLPDEEIAALIRRRGWQDIPTRQLGSLLRDEANVRVGQRRVGPLRDLARLNGTPVG